MIVERADRPLCEIAQGIYDLAQSYGKQADDQTLLLIRRRLASALTQQSCSELRVDS